MSVSVHSEENSAAEVITVMTDYISAYIYWSGVSAYIYRAGVAQCQAEKYLYLCQYLYMQTHTSLSKEQLLGKIIG